MLKLDKEKEIIELKKDYLRVLEKSTSTDILKVLTGGIILIGSLYTLGFLNKYWLTVFGVGIIIGSALIQYNMSLYYEDELIKLSKAIKKDQVLNLEFSFY